MNRENIEFAIKLMSEAKALNMCSYQSSEAIAKTVPGLHACGNTACFIGYLALTPEFTNFVIGALGGINSKVSYDGSLYEDGAYLEDLPPEMTLSAFLGIDRELAHRFIFNVPEFEEDYDYAGDDGDEKGCFYPVPFPEVEPKHVIEKLNQLLAGELQ